MQTLEQINYIKNWINDYCKSMLKEPESLIIGISGGIDSSVPSTLCALTGKKTIVLLMPIKQIKAQHTLSAQHENWLKNKFKTVESYLIDLDNVFQTFKNSIKFSNWILKDKTQSPNFFDAQRVHFIINKMIISSKKKKKIYIN